MSLTQVKMCVYLHDSQTTEAFIDFLSKVNQFFLDNNVNGVFIAEYLIKYTGINCPTDIKGCDLLVCVGPGKGGFVGPPYTPTSGLNTDLPFGFTQIGVQAACHEFSHFLGFQDLFWLKGAGIPLLPALLNDIMYNLYTNYPMLSKIPVGILNLNLDRLGNKTGILYPKYRMATSLRVITDYPNTSYQLFTRTRSYSIFESVLSSTPYRSGYTDSSGVFLTDIVAGDTVDNNFDVYRIAVAGVDIFIGCLVTEASFLFNKYATDCYVQGKPIWCNNLFGYTIESSPDGASVEIDGGAKK